MENIRIFIRKFSFFGRKISVYLNRLVFVMGKTVYGRYGSSYSFSFILTDIFYSCYFLYKKSHT